jgi:regulator of protease activity HflC (stomatin/prohibitin superfamily)
MSDARIEGRLEAILVRDVVLPDAIQRAIDQKLAAEQEVLKMKYVVEVARAAADEKRIEAQGIYDYNHIVSTSLRPPVLELERIEQLNKLAASPNAKTVVIGERQGGNPVLLSTPAGSRWALRAPQRRTFPR